MNLPFTGFSLLSSKKFRTHPSPSTQVTQFLEGPIPLPPFNKGGGGVPTMVYLKYLTLFEQVDTFI